MKKKDGQDRMMKTSLALIFLMVSAIPVFLNSCKPHTNQCRSRFNKLTDFTNHYAISSRPSTLDSALILANQCMQCDSFRKSVIELKIRILISMNKYAYASKFVDSLDDNDFSYPYKKTSTKMSIRALAANDTSNRNIILRQETAYLKEYINTSNLDNREFEEVYLDLFDAESRFLDVNTIKLQLDALKEKFPEKSNFFEQLRNINHSNETKE